MKKSIIVFHILAVIFLLINGPVFGMLNRFTKVGRFATTVQPTGRKLRVSNWTKNRFNWNRSNFNQTTFFKPRHFHIPLIFTAAVFSVEQNQQEFNSDEQSDDGSSDYVQKYLKEYEGLNQEEKDNRLFVETDLNKFVALIESGANVNATNIEGLTPLYTTKNREIFTLLLLKKETVVTSDIPRYLGENPEIVSLLEPIFLEKKWRQNTYAGMLYTFLEPATSFIERHVSR